jgi:hypothetical protein
MDEHPGDVFEDVAPADGEELERDETYVPGDPSKVVDLSAGEGSEADRLPGDDDGLGDEPPADPLSADGQRPTGETPSPEPAPDPTPAEAEPGSGPVPDAPAPVPEPEPEPAAPAPTPVPTPKPTPEKSAKGGKEKKPEQKRTYLVFLYSAEHPGVLHMQMQPAPEVAEGEDAPPAEPALIEATNWDRAMKLAYRQYAPEGGTIGIAVCPHRNFRQHIVSERPRQMENTGIHLG